MTPTENAYREFRDQLHRYIKRRVGSPEDAHDVLQEVFLRVLRNEKTFAQTDVPLAWLYRVTRSAIVDHYRKAGRTPTGSDAGLEMLSAPETAPEPEFERCIQPLLGNLPEIYRDALVFTDLNGGRQTEYARQTGIGTATAKSRVQRGRKLLKQAVLSCCSMEDIMSGGGNSNKCC
jgi:RNA polymerase sigma-70 factor (ECF subfamily)